MKRNVLDVPKIYVWYCHFFLAWFMCAIKITFREKIIVAENRYINSKLKKSWFHFFPESCRPSTKHISWFQFHLYSTLYLFSRYKSNISIFFDSWTHRYIWFKTVFFQGSLIALELCCIFIIFWIMYKAAFPFMMIFWSTSIRSKPCAWRVSNLSRLFYVQTVLRLLASIFNYSSRM